MTTLNHPTRITHEEIRTWAYDADPALPENANANVWDLMLLEWSPDPRLYVDLAADTTCPKQRYFLDLLRQSVRRKCARTRWLAGGADDVLRGYSPSHPGLAKRKGRGRKEKQRLWERLTESVHAEAVANGLAYARQLLRLLGTVHGQPSELVLLSKKLEAFVLDPATITDDYWAVLIPSGAAPTAEADGAGKA